MIDTFQGMRPSFGEKAIITGLKGVYHVIRTGVYYVPGLYKEGG